jgi:hypothetical protein
MDLLSNTSLDNSIVAVPEQLMSTTGTSGETKENYKNISSMISGLRAEI